MLRASAPQRRFAMRAHTLLMCRVLNMPMLPLRR